MYVRDNKKIIFFGICTNRHSNRDHHQSDNLTICPSHSSSVTHMFTLCLPLQEVDGYCFSVVHLCVWRYALVINSDKLMKHNTQCSSLGLNSSLYCPYHLLNTRVITLLLASLYGFISQFSVFP